MNALSADGRGGGSQDPAEGATGGATEPPVRHGGVVPSLDQRRIERALQARTRYKYVHPRVLREGLGWKIVSPNCSRNVDAQGGEIDIAWLVPHSGGWLLYSRDHVQDCWRLRGQDQVLFARDGTLDSSGDEFSRLPLKNVSELSRIKFAHGPFYLPPRMISDQVWTIFGNVMLRGTYSKP